jgi:Ion transport protein
LGFYKCLEGTFCGNPYDHGLDSSFDKVSDEVFINYGVLTFDHIGKGLLSVFQILTNDNWALTMYNLMNVDNPVLATIFLSAIVVLGSFFLINIILAVILDSFISV